MTVVLNLGGTISLSYANGKPKDVGLRGVVDPCVPVIDIAPVQSNALNWQHLRLLRQRLLEGWQAAEARFLVTVGTDSLEEVAYFLSLVTPPRVAVAVVGALRTRSDPDYDGAHWVSVANEWLQREDSSGVVVCCGGPPIAAARVQKVYLNGWTFQPSPVDDDRLRPWVLDARHDLTKRPPRVPILTIAVGAGPCLLPMLETGRFDGIVLEAFAAGDIPPVLVRVVQRLLLDQTPVVLASRSRPGLIEPLFPGVPGCSSDLISAGALGAGRLDGVRARIRLLVAMAARPCTMVSSAFVPI